MDTVGRMLKLREAVRGWWNLVARQRIRRFEGQVRTSICRQTRGEDETSEVVYCIGCLKGRVETVLRKVFSYDGCVGAGAW